MLSPECYRVQTVLNAETVLSRPWSGAWSLIRQNIYSPEQQCQDTGENSSAESQSSATASQRLRGLTAGLTSAEVGSAFPLEPLEARLQNKSRLRSTLQLQ